MKSIIDESPKETLEDTFTLECIKYILEACKTLYGKTKVTEIENKLLLVNERKDF